MVKYTRARGLLGKAFKSLSGSLKGHELDEIGTACTLQLWVETNYADQKANVNLACCSLTLCGLLT